MTEEREESRIQWHPAFYAATKLELRDNIDELEFYPEYKLEQEAAAGRPAYHREEQ